MATKKRTSVSPRTRKKKVEKPEPEKAEVFTVVDHGGELVPVTDVEKTTTEPKTPRKPREPTKARIKREREVNANLLAPAVGILIDAIFRIIAKRSGEHWKPDAEERTELSNATAMLMVKYLPSVEDFTEELVFITVVALFVSARMPLPSITEVKEITTEVTDEIKQP